MEKAFKSVRWDEETYREPGTSTGQVVSYDTELVGAPTRQMCEYNGLQFDDHVIVINTWLFLLLSGSGTGSPFN